MDADYYLEEVRSEAGFYGSVVDRLCRENWLRKDDRVLDIGCGPGTLSIPLSEKARSVTALDEAEGMLNTLRGEIGARGIENIVTHRSSWMEAGYEDDFDLVLASLSPAIRSGRDMLAMERASRDRCCLITACPSEWMTVRNELWEKVVGSFTPSDAHSIRYPMNVLLDRKRAPELFQVRARTVVGHPSSEVVEHYLRYFGIFTTVDEERARTIEEHVMSRSKDGFFERRGEKCLYLLCWRKG